MTTAWLYGVFVIKDLRYTTEIYPANGRILEIVQLRSTLIDISKTVKKSGH
jgi:hypothetical protein